LRKIVVQEAEVGPVKIPRLLFGPEEIQLDPSIVQVQGGSIRASVLGAGASQPLQAQVAISKFPLGAILSPMIQDARGPLDGFVDLQFTGQASGARIDDLQRTLAGQGNFRLYQAHLENLPLVYNGMLKEAGRSLGSQQFIPSSEINSCTLVWTIQKSEVSISNLEITGSALQLGLSGSVNLVNRQMYLKGPLGLTRDAIQSCGALQGLVLDNKFANPNDFYVKMPGDLEISGPWDNPRVDFDKLKAFWRGALNLSIGFLQGTGDAANGAAGAALGAPGSVLQGVGNLFKGF